MIVCLIVEILQCLCGESSLGRFTTDTEMLPSPRYGDIKDRFNLPEILVQGAAKIGKTLVIRWGKGNFYRFGLQRRVKAAQYLIGEVLILAAIGGLCKGAQSVARGAPQSGDRAASGAATAILAVALFQVARILARLARGAPQSGDRAASGAATAILAVALFQVARILARLARGAPQSGDRAASGAATAILAVALFQVARILARLARGAPQSGDRAASGAATAILAVALFQVARISGSSASHKNLFRDSLTLALYNSPRSECDKAAVIFTLAKWPIISGSPAKFTMRLLSVRPHSSPASFLD